jgi:hypothetical protein
MRPSMRLLLLFQVVAASTLAAQSSRRDLTGTWVLDIAKSSFGSSPAPASDSMIVTRSGGMYRIDQYTIISEGPQHMTSQWPVGDGRVTNEIPEQGATTHSTITMQGDTAIFSGDITVQGQAIATESGSQFVSADGKTLTRIADIQPQIAGVSDAMHMVTVYDRKR